MPAGYEKLIVYHQAVLIYDLNYLFCQQYLSNFKNKRNVEQIIQAARSGKQNIVEASLEKKCQTEH